MNRPNSIFSFFIKTSTMYSNHESHSQQQQKAIKCCTAADHIMRNTVVNGTEQSKIDALATFGDPENITTAQMSRSLADNTSTVSNGTVRYRTTKDD